MNAIEASNLCQRVGFFQLKDISLVIPKGKMTAIIGPNGSGKSTFLKITAQLMGMDEGEILVQDQPIHTYKRREFAKTISMLPQSKEELPDLCVRELVSYGRSPHHSFLHKGSKAADEAVIDWALDITGTKKHESRMFHELSGGEQQKARIAMALAQKTDILLLDEPTTYLDMAHQLDLMEMLQEINDQYGITIVMVLHDLQQAAAYSHYMIALKGGCLIDQGKPKELLTASFLQKVYNITAKIHFDEDYPVIIPQLKQRRLIV